jgi:hypothetical protein
MEDWATPIIVGQERVLLPSQAGMTIEKRGRQLEKYFRKLSFGEFF